LTAPGKRITVPVALGAAGGISNKFAAVTLHHGFRNSDGLIVINGTPASTGPMRESAMLMDLFDTDLPAIETSCNSYSSIGSVWTISSRSPTGTTEDITLSRIVTSLMAMGAYPGSHAKHGYSAGPSSQDLEQCRKLEADGLAIGTNAANGSVLWYLTDEGLEQISSFPQLGVPQQVFSLRHDIALKDRTTYEFILLLKADGWQWQKWIPPSKRTKKILPPPIGYVSGADKIWMSSDVQVNWNYLLLLLQAEVPLNYTLPQGSIKVYD
jgi:hypothetical protein